jgi:hypothetical protein
VCEFLDGARLDRVGDVAQLLFLRRALSATHERVSAQDEERVHCVGFPGELVLKAVQDA